MTRKSELMNLVGTEVTVAVSTQGIVRNGFFTQISIKGILEELDGSFRIVKDNCTFVYFELEDVYLINPLVSTGVVIHTRIDTPKEEDL